LSQIAIAFQLHNMRTIAWRRSVTEQLVEEKLPVSTLSDGFRQRVTPAFCDANMIGVGDLIRAKKH